MIVLDASALVDLLLGTRRGRAVAVRIAAPDLSLHAPHLIDVEVTQAIRRYVAEGDLDQDGAVGALEALRGLCLERHSHEPLIERAWALRHSLSVYEAVYVALAEALDTRVLTCDGRLARSPAATGRAELIR
jgi:predicted nucleic acid-binding protein